MKLDCKFKNLDWSESLVDYARTKFEKLAKVELKPLKVHMFVSAERHKKMVEVCIHAYDATYRAQAYSDDFYESVDKAFQKLKSQLVKKKNKMQKHRHYDHSDSAKIDRLNEQLEMLSYEEYKKAS